VADENGTREKIISLALELFAQNGFSATSMRQIAKTVGIRESSIYNHFASKDEILEAVLSAHGFGFVKNILEKKYLDREIDDPHSLLTEILDDIMNRWTDPEDRDFVKVLLMEMYRTEAARNTYNRDIDTSRTFLVKLFQKMAEQNMIKPMDPWVLANEFFQLLVGVHIEYLARIQGNEDVTPIYKCLRQQHVDFFWNAIKKE